MRALEEQARTLWHVSNHFFIPRQVELAERLLALTPFAARAFFCNSGAEANEAMLKLARKYHADRGHPERHEIVACADSFHGRTLFTVTVGGQPKYHHRASSRSSRACATCPYGDLAALEAALTPRTAAFIVEPILGEAGVVPAPDGYLDAARALTRRAGALLCLDEVQTGMGRTGRMWAHEWDRRRARPHVERPRRSAAASPSARCSPPRRWASTSPPAATAAPSAATRSPARWRWRCCGSSPRGACWSAPARWAPGCAPPWPPCRGVREVRGRGTSSAWCWRRRGPPRWARPAASAACS